MIKKVVMVALMVMVGLSAMAQSESTTPSKSKMSVDWLQSFRGVKISGPMYVEFIGVDSDKEMKLSYGSNPSTPSRVKAVVDKNGILNIREKTSRNQVDTTRIQIYYKELKNLEVSQAVVSFTGGAVEEPMMDIALSGGAKINMELEVDDLVVTVSGKCDATFSGEARYFDLTVSSGRVDASQMETMSARVDASSNAWVWVSSYERFECNAISAKVRYSGKPIYTRTQISPFGGAIIAVEE